MQMSKWATYFKINLRPLTIYIVQHEPTGYPYVSMDVAKSMETYLNIHIQSHIWTFFVCKRNKKFMYILLKMY